MQVDLVQLDDAISSRGWPLGDAYLVGATPAAVDSFLRQRLTSSPADALLFWDGSLGDPDPEHVRRLLRGSCDLWHSGLRLGMQGLPKILNSISPTWMLTADPDPGIEATSWRLSLRCCLVRADVLRSLGGPRDDFDTLAGASLEMGHRYITRGVVARHVPSLVAREEMSDPLRLPFKDELRFVSYRFGRRWVLWALARAAISGRISLVQAARSVRELRSGRSPVVEEPFHSQREEPTDVGPDQSVTVLIPTVERYAYLRTLLNQLRLQTLPASQIIVVDQSPKRNRDTSLNEDFSDLPLEILYQDHPGQCSSRNRGLQRATGTFVLFLDDDDEVPPGLIEDHLKSLKRHEADASCGVADEIGAGPLPEGFRFTRVSDVFPANNTLIRKEVLQRSGLFDLAYENGPRADGDLGMRVYSSGALMILEPRISVLHHHAPRGGLRTHRARVVTYANSRTTLRHRQIVTATEFYLARRYSGEEAAKEKAWLSALGTFSIRGGLVRKSLKFLIAFALLPHTVWRIRKEWSLMKGMMRRFPEIPSLR